MQHGADGRNAHEGAVCAGEGCAHGGFHVETKGHAALALDCQARRGVNAAGKRVRSDAELPGKLLSLPGRPAGL